MKATITLEVTAEELTAIIDKLREHRIADQKEWEENHPHPMPPFMTDEPIKKTKPN